MTPVERKVCDALLKEMFDVGPLTPAGKFWLPYLAIAAALIAWLVYAWLC